MSKETQNTKHKLREFQWFEMETKVRQMVQELLAPFSKRVFQTMSSVSSLKTFTMQESRKLQNLRKVITDDPASKQIDIFRAIDKKQQGLQVQIAELHNLMRQTQKIIDRRFLIQDQRLDENRQVILNNMKLKQRISEQIMEQNNSLKLFRTQTQEVINDFSKKINTIIKDHEQDLKATKSAISKLDDKICILQEFKISSEFKSQANKQQHMRFFKDILNNQENIKLINKEIQVLHQNTVYTKKLANYVKELEERINKQQYQNQNISPLITQAQISETLYNIFPPKLKRSLFVYDYYRYSKLNNQILQTDHKKIQTQPFNGIMMLQNVQKRTSKAIIDMKRKKLVQQGIDVDDLTHQLKEKYYKQVDLTEHHFEDEQQHKHKPGIERQQVIKMIQQMLDFSKNELTRHITTQFDDSRKYIQSLQEQIQHNFGATNELFQKVKLQFESFKCEQVLNNRHHTQRFDGLQNDYSNFQKEITTIRQTLTLFIKFCSLINHLQIQDELDKQSISLFGIKETFNQQPATGTSQDYPTHQQFRSNKVIDIKKECFSCSGFPASTIAAFKMACLTYSPSSIILESKQFKREEILQMSTKLLHSLKMQLNELSSSGVQFLNPEAQCKNTFLDQSQIKNVFLYNTPNMNRTSKDFKHSIDLKEQRNKSKRLNTANTNIRTSTRLSTSVHMSNKKRQNNSLSLLSSTFIEQQKKHAHYLS